MKQARPAAKWIVPGPARRETDRENLLFGCQSALVMLDDAERVWRWTSAEIRMFHRQASEVVGKPLADLGIFLEKGEGLEPLLTTDQIGEGDANARILLPEGATRWVILRVIEFPAGVGRAIFARDLGPELRHMRIQKLASRLRSVRFSSQGAMSHSELLDEVRDFFEADHALICDITDGAEDGCKLLAHRWAEGARSLSEETLAHLCLLGQQRSIASGPAGRISLPDAEEGALSILAGRFDGSDGRAKALLLARFAGRADWMDLDAAVFFDAGDLLALAFESARPPAARSVGNRYLESILRSSDLGIVFAEIREGAIIFSLANHMFFEFFGKETADFSGGPVGALAEHLFSCSADPERARENLISHFQAGGERVGELTTRRPAHRILRIFSAPATDEGEVVGRIILFRDITRDKEIEQQLLHSQKMESIGTLAGGIAHDFNNLLTTMLGYSELLKSEMSPGHPSYAKIEQIERSARRAAELTSNLLAFSRRSPTQMTVCDLSELVRESVALVRFSVPSSIEIRMHLADGLPFVEADPTQIQQVLINLMLNARDALPKFGGRITVATRQAEDPMNPVSAGGPRYVLIEVSDNGCGISEESLPRIFEPFYTTKEVGKGTGLGLAMVYGIVKQHHGFIEVSSAPGEGSVFTVFLPETKKPMLPPPETIPKTVSAHKSSARKSSARILIVDDELDLLEFCRSALEPVCGSVRTASDGLEALMMVEAAPDDFDLVILDLTMPRMGGVECFYRMRRIRPDLKIIISSGYSVEGGPENLLQSGAAAFLQKPYNVEVLLRTVRANLNQTPTLASLYSPSIQKKPAS